MKEFNTTAVCISSKHYMVDLTERVAQIRKLVDAGKYFTINRARQYGKTTTITALRKSLASDYSVVSLDFQGLGNASFRTEEEFCKGFVGLILNKLEYDLISIPDEISDQFNCFVLAGQDNNKLEDLMRIIRRWCGKSAQPVVLIIDEVDTASNNQVFLDFLAQLRDGYISRDTDDIPAFRSVILAGVTDVKHLKRKIRPDDDSNENRSSPDGHPTSKMWDNPWNIATDFTIDMSLSEDGIKGMLDEYEADHQIGMDTQVVARSIHDHTNGYPFLVSRICQLIDTQVCNMMMASDSWTNRGIDEAVKLILVEWNTLFDSLTKKLNNLPGLKASIRSILMEGKKLTWNPDNSEIALMEMYGLIKNDHNTVRIANRIFETRLYNLFLSDEELQSNRRM